MKNKFYKYGEKAAIDFIEKAKGSLQTMELINQYINMARIHFEYNNNIRLTSSEHIHDQVSFIDGFWDKYYKLNPNMVAEHIKMMSKPKELL